MKEKDRPAAGAHKGIDLIDRLEETQPWRRGLIVFLTLAVILCILMPELIFQNRIFLVPDSKAPLSFASVGRETLESGTYPLWNPYLFCGMPSYPSLAYTPYVYPVSYITHVLHSYMRFPEMTWLLVHYLIAGIGVYLLLRSLEVRAILALLAGAVFMIMPNFVAAGANGHGSQASAIAYMPLAILFARNIFRGYHRIPMTAFLAIILGFQMLRGHVQISYYTFLIIALLFIVESIHLLRRGQRRAIGINLVFAAIAFALAVGIASVLIFPVRGYASLSIRGGDGGGGLDYGYATGWSLHPKEMLTFLFAWSFGFGKKTYWGEMPFTDYPNYIGAVTAFFAVLAVFIVRNRWKWFFIVAAVLSTLISFGRFFPVLYDPMFRLLPFFNKFRVPVMILIVQQLSLVVLMAMGIESLVARHRDGTLPKQLSTDSMKWLTIALAVVFIIVLISGGSIENGVATSPAVAGKVSGEMVPIAADAFAKDLIKTVVMFGAISLAVFLFVAGKLRHGNLMIVLFVVSLVDLLVVDRLVVHPESGWKNDGYRIIRRIEDREDYLKPDPIVDFLKQDSSYFRIFPAPAAPLANWSHSTPPFSDNRYMVFGIFSMGGYHAAKLRNYQDVMDRMFTVFKQGSVPISILNMLNAKYIVSLVPLFRESSYFPTVWQQGRVYIYENRGVLPRVFFVSAYRVLSPDRILHTLGERDFDPSAEVLLEREPAVAPVSAEGSHAEISDYRLNSFTVKAHVEEPCIMVVSEIAYPDWQVSVDGERGEVLTANYCLRAVPLEAGDHEIGFVFASGMLRRSLIVSIIAFAVAAAMPIASRLLAREKE
ncbi:MAG: hypothetical protein JSV33_06480 [bacterium]|nr:MAG: hypothetical protein JSV33_06480 [bacterium]